MKRFSLLAALGLSAAICTSPLLAQDPAPAPPPSEYAPLDSGGIVPTREVTAASPFAPEIYTFLVEDEVLGTQPCSTLFLGSSSIRFWFNLEEDFPDRRVVRRGFGGSQIAHSIYYFDLIVAPHRPREIVFYAGENDLHAGLTPEQVRDALLDFLALKSDRLGAVPVYFISIKPSFARAAELGEQQSANRLIRALAETRSDLVFIDVADAMMAEGAPREVFVSDRLHMNLDGYAIWRDIVSSSLGAAAPSSAEHCSR